MRAEHSNFDFSSKTALETREEQLNQIVQQKEKEIAELLQKKEQALEAISHLMGKNGSPMEAGEARDAED